MSNINAIATAAARLGRKPSKAQAFEVLKGLIQDGSLPVSDAARLYAFFLPTPPAKPKTDAQWCQRAVKTKGSLASLSTLYSDGKRLIGCDGHRLHIVPSDLAEGRYDQALNRIEDDLGKYPDVDRAIPAWTESCTITVRTEDLPVEIVEPYHCYRLPCGALVNKTYWDDATARAEEVRYLPGDDPENSAIRLNLEGDRVAVIMPIRNL